MHQVVQSAALVCGDFQVAVLTNRSEYKEHNQVTEYQQ
jgi:hypothetical protein